MSDVKKWHDKSVETAARMLYMISEDIRKEFESPEHFIGRIRNLNIHNTGITMNSSFPGLVITTYVKDGVLNGYASLTPEVVSTFIMDAITKGNPRISIDLPCVGLLSFDLDASAITQS